jgi:hypothetical protein
MLSRLRDAEKCREKIGCAGYTSRGKVALLVRPDEPLEREEEENCEE